MIPFDAAFVETLRETALCYPHNPLEGMAPEECNFEDVEFQGHRLTIMLTYEYFTPDSPKQAWHLSVNNSDNTEADREIVMKVVLSIFGYGSIMEITKSMPEEFQFIRQFMKQESRVFDVNKKEFVL